MPWPPQYRPLPAGHDPLESPHWSATPEGIAVKPRYVAADRAGLDFVDGFPGLAPFGRGPYPTMYVQQPWTMQTPDSQVSPSGQQQLSSTGASLAGTG